jgi:division/cell wall cluster transcriptional repressor MraZ
MLDTNFIGMEEMTVDDKGRVGIPARYMQVLQALDPDFDRKVGLVLTPDRSVKILPMPQFRALLAKWEGYNDEFEEDRLLLNVRPAMADVAALDKQNRIKIAPRMLKICGIERNVVISGHMKFMQLFSDTAFDALYETGLPASGAAASRAATRGQAPQPIQYVINTTPTQQ